MVKSLKIVAPTALTHTKFEPCSSSSFHLGYREAKRANLAIVYITIRRWRLLLQRTSFETEGMEGRREVTSNTKTVREAGMYYAFSFSREGAVRTETRNNEKDRLNDVLWDGRPSYRRGVQDRFRELDLPVLRRSRRRYISRDCWGSVGGRIRLDLGDGKVTHGCFTEIYRGR